MSLEETFTYLNTNLNAFATTPIVASNFPIHIPKVEVVQLKANVWEKPKRPLTVSKDEGIRFNINEIERDVFYLVDYDGEKYAVRVTNDGILERYEIVEE